MWDKLPTTLIYVGTLAIKVFMWAQPHLYISLAVFVHKCKDHTFNQKWKIQVGQYELDLHMHSVVRRKRKKDKSFLLISRPHHHILKISN